MKPMLLCRAVCFWSLAVAALPAGAQEVGATKSEILRQAIVTPDTAILPLPPEVVCGPQVWATEVSPSRRSVIIVRQTAPPPRDITEFLSGGDSDSEERSKAFVRSGQAELQILLWRAGSRRASVVWRRTANETTGAAYPLGVRWLAGTEAALVQIDNTPGPLFAPEPDDEDHTPPASAKPPHTTTLLRVNAATGKTDTLTTEPTPITGLMASPSAPVAVLKSSDLKRLYIVGATGPLQGPIPPAWNVPGGEYVRLQGWMADGKRLWGTFYGKANANGKSPSRPVTLHLETNTLADEKPGVDVRAIAPAPPSLPYTLHPLPVTLTREETERPAMALWMGASPAHAEQRTLLAVGVDTRPDVVALTSAVFYQQAGTLYVRPLATLKPDVFIAARDAEYRAETLRRARSIGASLENHASLYGKGFLPPPGAVLKTLQDAPFGILVETETFRNPATGKPGFTATYSAVLLSEYPAPAKARLGYLAGPSGRAVVYLDGHSEWEPTPPKP